MEKGLVSIITPCYNGEKYVKRILDSILIQTYPNIQFIFINDGSTDRTEEIIKSYQEKFNERGYQFIYKCKKNGGQASAINEGLKYVTGEYLTWPDADDSLTHDSIQKKVDFLIHNEQYGFVLTKANIIDEDTNKVIGMLEHKEKVSDYIFENLVFQKDIWFAPGSYMVKMKAFEKVNPQKQIYESRGGQNWQMLLPIAFKYRCGYLPEPLYNYYLRKDSHSHQKGTFEKEIQKIDRYEDILKNELKKLNVYLKYKEDLDLKFHKQKINIAYKFNKIDEFKKQYTFLRNKNKLSLKIKIKRILIYMRKKNNE